MIDALDTPVINAINYFTSMMGYFMSISTKMGMVLGLLGLGWSAFRTINQRMQIRELWWDTIYKWLLYIAVLAMWVPLTTGISKVATQIGTTAGNSDNQLEKQLVNFKEKILKLSYVENASIATKIDNLLADEDLGDLSKNLRERQTAYEYSEDVIRQLENADISSGKKKKLIKKIREKQEDAANLSSVKTLKAINEIIGGKDEADYNASYYISKNMTMKGSANGYLSAAAIFRFSSLICQIIALTEEMNVLEDMKNLADQDLGFVERIGAQMSLSFSHLGESFMCLILCFAITLCCIFAIIQYVMTCIEFTIISAVGVFFVPFILFDGTKELPKKFVPVYISLFMKMLLITLCMFYVMWSYLALAGDLLQSSGGMNWFNVGAILLNVAIGFVLTQNAPKIATTITTGQAQLSMGELVAAAGTMIGAAKFSGKAAKFGGKAAVGAARKTANGAVNTVNGAHKLNSAYHAASKLAYDAAIKNGKNPVQAKNYAAKVGRHAVLSSVGGGVKERLANAGNNFLHKSKDGSGSHGGSGSSGSQAHLRNGTKRDGSPINNYSNPSFRNATKFDEASNSQVNMTMKEAYNESGLQGSNIGKNTAEKMNAKKFGNSDE